MTGHDASSRISATEKKARLTSYAVNIVENCLVERAVFLGPLKGALSLYR